jgi:hypothetical protein
MAIVPGKPQGEGLFSSGGVRLFGRPYNGLQIGELGINPTSNNPLQVMLGQKFNDKANPPQLARIYGFTYLGNYFKLAEPLVFLVFGKGAEIKSGYPTPDVSLDDLGLESKGLDFTAGVWMWMADQADIALRIDITIGWLNDILLSEEMGSDNNMTGGAQLRRSDIVGHDGSLVGRDGSMVGRDGSMVGRDGSLVGRDGSFVGRRRG